jgi:hypothetical protein
MRIQQAIESAIKGGYNLRGNYKNDEGLGFPEWKYDSSYIYFYQTRLGFGGDPGRAKWTMPFEVILLDTDFWRALGRGLGWEKYEDEMSLNTTLRHHYLEQWHRFIDHLATGKSIESFFDELK